MNKLKNVPYYIITYISWVGSILLFLWFILISRQTLLAVLRNYWARENFGRQFAINFIDRAYVVILGIAWLVLMIVSETYFRNGIKKGEVFQRIGKVIGPLLLAIAVVDFIMTVMIGTSVQPFLRWAILFTEFAGGLGLVWVGWKIPGANLAREDQ